ncbi:MAG: methionine--tRNA ligase [Patescibacteria group bacterium]
MKNNIYITASIPYVNASPHLGHSLEAVQVDVLSRYYRKKLDKSNVYSLWGSDENASKNVEAAKKVKSKVQTFVDKHSKEFYNLKTVLNLSFDDFIKTSSLKHKKGAQKLWQLCLNDIYKKKYKGLYCNGCENFYRDQEFENNTCPYHNRKLEMFEEENYFFALSKYQDKLIKIIESNEYEIFPEFRKKEVLNFIRNGLEDFSISRPAQRTGGWGVPVPNDKQQIMYVWFDALANYITGIGFHNNEKLYTKFWITSKERIHVVGKDIIKFHAVYWPAMLLSAGLNIPTKLFVHGFITIAGEKMSKTIGNIVDPYEIAKKYGTDAFRYYLLREIPTIRDGDFSTNRFEELYNSDLANTLGNLISRITNLCEKNEIEIINKNQELDGDISALTENYNFNIALELVWKKLAKIDADINKNAPWNLEGKKAKTYLQNCVKEIRSIVKNLSPYLPETTKKILKSTEGKIKKISPLFPRI